MDRKAHWEKIYSTKSHREVSWFAEHVSTSLDLFRLANPAKTGAVIDVGGGASTLVDDLVEAGYLDLTVLDISGAALEIARTRLEAVASAVRWIEADVLESDLGGREYEVWHDRAVFHFLTAEEDREKYRDQVIRHLRPGGSLLISVFADDGPGKCSGLTIKRHGEDEITEFFAEGFDKLHSARSIHSTPAGVEQRFINLILRRKDSGPKP